MKKFRGNGQLGFIVRDKDRCNKEIYNKIPATFTNCSYLWIIVMEIGRHRSMRANAHIKIGSNSYEKVKTFKYLGSLLTNPGTRLCV